ncbi:MAG: hypothetical protein P8I95_07210 [Alphaproteobacteria bacterium]|jgi:hypothetical protein|nr:hypothetical protein [Alphaproteobacteria bacterium]
MSKGQKPAVKNQARQQKLAEALRANLQRRKAGRTQARQAQAAAPEDKSDG